MAKKVVWTKTALNDKKEILAYWINRNKSNRYSIKLEQLFREAVTFLSEYPTIGVPSIIEGVRGRLVRDYYIFYRESEDEIYILTIWDQRMDPIKLKEKLSQ